MLRTALLVTGMVGVLLVGGSAAAEPLQGRAELGVDTTGVATGCYLTLHKMARVHHNDRNNRWLKVVTSVDCTDSTVNWTQGHIKVRIMGLGRQGAWGTRAMIEARYDEGILAGETKRLKETVRCNHKPRAAGGQWIYDRNNMGVRGWAEVHVDRDPWNGVTIEDRDTGIWC